MVTLLATSPNRVTWGQGLGAGSMVVCVCVQNWGGIRGQEGLRS